MFDLPTILQAGEGLQSEFKTSFKEDVIETLVAFSNAKGGTVYIGISDKGDVFGVKIGKETITIEQLLTNNYVSTPRNRQIAKIVKEMGWIEKYGTGIKRVRNMFVDYGLKQPLLEIIPGGFAATVFAENNGSVENVTDNVVDNRLKKIIDLLKSNNKLSAQELSEYFGVSSRTIQRDLDKLKENGKLVRIGSEKGGYWEINN